jgi:hypothetical protein
MPPAAPGEADGTEDALAREGDDSAVAMAIE